MKLLRLYPVIGSIQLTKMDPDFKGDLLTAYFQVKSLQLSWASLAWPNWSSRHRRNEGERDPGTEQNTEALKYGQAAALKSQLAASFSVEESEKTSYHDKEKLNF